MKNTLPYTNPELLTLAGVAAIGASQYGAAIPLLQNTHNNIHADVQPLVDAIMAHGLGRTEMNTRRDTLDSVVRNCRVILMLGRDSMKPQFGNQFNLSWLPLGHDGSLEISEDVPQLSMLLNSYKEFLESNPDNELPTKNFTALHLDALSAQLEAANGAVSLQDTALGLLKEDRDAKADKLRKRLRGLANELDQTLDPLDQRWKAFGFNMPGAQESPEVVEQLVALLIGPNAAALKWNASARAEYYHVFKKVVGVDADYVLVGSPADRDFTLENLPANAHVDIVVSAVNNGGEGAVSEKVTIVTH